MKILFALISLIYIGVPSMAAYSPALVHSNVPKHPAINTLHSTKPLVKPSLPVTPEASKPQLTSSSPVYSTPVPKPSLSTAPTPVSSTPVSNTTTPDDSDKCYSGPCTNVNGPTYDQYGNEYDDQGNIIQYLPSCAPNATEQDPCKLGQCFGYPYGICESNPNQGEINKDEN